MTLVTEDNAVKAVEDGDLAILKAWVSGGGDVVALSAGPKAILHRAAAKGHVAIIRYLLDQGVPSHSYNSAKNGSALDEAIYARQEDAAALLLVRGAFLHECYDDKLKGRDTIKGMVLASRVVRKWILLEQDEIAFVRPKIPLGYKLTDIFNFSGRTVTQIVHNLLTNAETAVQRNFSDFENDKAVRKAEKELVARGGVVPDHETLEKARPPGAPSPACGRRLG